jgi:hypothetical protein
MKQYVINAKVTKNSKDERRCFGVELESTQESAVKPTILEKFKIDDKFELIKEKYQVVESENVIIYYGDFKLKSTN